MTKPDTRVYFIDGWSPRCGLFAALAFPHHLKGQDVEFCRLYTLAGDKWFQTPFDFDGRSITYMSSGDYRAWWILGKRGEVVEITAGQSRTEQVPDAGTGAGKLGYLNKLAVIGGDLYACGYQRQVYVREDGAWRSLSKSIEPAQHTMGIGFESIDGTGPDDLYAVGYKGEIWHFDGRAWTQCASPTNVGLTEVRVVDSKNVYACGRRGIVVHGSGNSWNVLHNPDFSDDLWGVEVYQDIVYVAGFGGLAKIEQGAIVPFDPGVGHRIAGYRLHASDGILWSIGNDEILCYDGARWSEIICPDNL